MFPLTVFMFSLTVFSAVQGISTCFRSLFFFQFKVLNMFSLTIFSQFIAHFVVVVQVLLMRREV